MSATAETSSRRKAWLVGPGLAALLLVLMGVSNLRYPTAGDAEPYHAAIRDAASEVALDFGPWQGTPSEIPEAAVELLKPNLLTGRSYVDEENRRAAEFVLVQCRDARDLSGHWPPRCYKANGYTQSGQQDRDWTVDGVTLPGVEYTFVRQSANERSEIVVANFLILPTVGYVRDMESVYEAGADYSRRHLGAAQVQVVTLASTPAEVRDDIFRELIGHHLPVISRVAATDTPMP
jgi:hypothetical protein